MVLVPMQFRRFSLEKRQQLARTMSEEYPDRVPVIVSPSKDAPSITKTKFLCPHDRPVAWFLGEIRKHIAVNPQEALFVFVEKSDHSMILPQQAAAMSQLHHQFKHTDNFLYMHYALENTFGAACLFRLPRDARDPTFQGVRHCRF